MHSRIGRRAIDNDILYVDNIENFMPISFTITLRGLFTQKLPRHRGGMSADI